MSKLHDIIRYWVPTSLIVLFCLFIVIAPDHQTTFLERATLALWFWGGVFLGVFGEDIADFIIQKIKNRKRL